MLPLMGRQCLLATKALHQQHQRYLAATDGRMTKRSKGGLMTKRSKGIFCKGLSSNRIKGGAVVVPPEDCLKASSRGQMSSNGPSSSGVIA